MPQAHTAKLFRNGASQAVRLPAEYRFEGSEVYISRNDATGDVILSSRPSAGAWDAFFAEVPLHVEDFDRFPEYMADRPMNQITRDRDIFGLDEFEEKI
jgi:antitoxin VapB